ncbi:MAG: alpha/beta hydrolase, partial [Alphaproteobacteria bacterium]
AFKEQNEQVVRQYGPTVMRTRLGGVSVLDIKPRDWRETAEVLVYTHGGAYTLFSAESTLISAVPVAHDTGRRVISVDYTLAPFSKWPETTDQVVAVIKALLEDGRALENVAIYGDSAGGGLAAGSVLKMRDRELGMPAAVVLWSPWSDIAEIGDTYFTLKEADPLLDYSKQLKNSADAYADPGDHKHPYVSPVYADYGKGFPPTLIQGGTKEIFLSNFIRHYQALDLAGVTAKLDLFEGMWHVFQAFHSDLLESRLARQKMKRFLDAHVKA